MDRFDKVVKELTLLLRAVLRTEGTLLLPAACIIPTTHLVTIKSVLLRLDRLTRELLIPSILDILVSIPAFSRST